MGGGEPHCSSSGGEATSLGPEDPPPHTHTIHATAAGPRDCIGQSLAKIEAMGVLALVCGRFELGVADEMGGRGAVRGSEVMRLTLQREGGMLLRLRERP